MTRFPAASCIDSSTLALHIQHLHTSFPLAAPHNCHSGSWSLHLSLVTCAIIVISHTIQPSLLSTETATPHTMSAHLPATACRLIPLLVSSFCLLLVSVSSLSSLSHGQSDVMSLTVGEWLAVQSAANTSRLFSLTFVAGESEFADVSANDSIITIAVVADVGTTALYVIGGYGRAPSSDTYKASSEVQSAEQLLQLQSVSLCGSGNHDALPGSSPPLCQLRAAVVTPVAASYRILVTVDPTLYTRLTASVPMVAFASLAHSAYLSFHVPHTVNAALTTTVFNGASGVTLMVGSWTSKFRTVWTAEQQPGSRVALAQRHGVVPAVEWRDHQPHHRCVQSDGSLVDGVQRDDGRHVQHRCGGCRPSDQHRHPGGDLLVGADHDGGLLGYLWWWQPDGRLRMCRSEWCGDRQQPVFARHSTAVHSGMQHPSVQRFLGTDVHRQLFGSLWWRRAVGRVCM